MNIYMVCDADEQEIVGMLACNGDEICRSFLASVPLELKPPFAYRLVHPSRQYASADEYMDEFAKHAGLLPADPSATRAMGVDPRDIPKATKKK